MTLAVGEVQPVTVRLGREVPAGSWQARIALRSGLVERTLVATVTIGRGGSVRDPRPAWKLPAAAVLALLLLQAFGYGVIRLRRRRGNVR
jgi:hypothetical protein